MFRFVAIYALKRAVLFFSLLSFCFQANAQVLSPNPTVPSVGIAGDKQAIEVSNDLYNGKLNVSIPVYNYQFEGIDFPIVLNYVGGNGIKPDEVPGWVGSGWSLEAGGYIHRTVRGKPDEARDWETEIIAPSVPNDLPKKKTTLKNTSFNYLSNYGLLNTNSNWYTQAYAESLKPNGPYFPYKVGLSEFFNSNPIVDLVPDEFTFSCGGISGKFYLNHENKWVVAANDGKKYSVEIGLEEQTLVDYNVQQTNSRVFYKTPQIIKRIILTSVDGIKYSFGNTQSNDVLANQRYDYSHTSAVLPTSALYQVPPLQGVPGKEAATLCEIVPHTWHLTRIENLNTGSVITLDYKQGFTFYKTKYAWGRANTSGEASIVYNNTYLVWDDPDNSWDYHYLSAISKVLNKGWTLMAINFPDGVKLNFNSSLSSQLSTTENLMTSENSGFYSYEDIFYHSGISGQKNNLLKLDNIQISHDGKVKKEIEFNYVLSGSQRLQLDRVLNRAGTSAVNEYKFTYNNTVPLPAYGAGKNDHWGYFNDQDFFTAVQKPYNVNNLSTYTNYREPNTAKCKAEILTGIKYPDGGSVEFTYEGHKYSQTRTLANVTNLQTDKDAGGVRIAKMSYYSAANQLEYEKQFEYTIPGTNLSSGVLGIPVPNYLVPDTYGHSFEAAGYNPTCYEGNNVNYTFATEKQAGNGKILYEYTNYDNGFNDAPPIGTNATGKAIFPYAYKHNAFKRGKPKSIKIFPENSQQPVKETVFHYTHENSETDKAEVRSLYIMPYATLVYAAVSERIYPNRVISQEEITFSGNSTASKKRLISYDIYGNVTEILSYDSKGERDRQLFKYCYEYATTGTDDVSAGINKLDQLGIKSSVVESLTIHEEANGANPVIVDGELFVYKAQAPFVYKKYKLNIIAPISYTPAFWSTVSNGVFEKNNGYTQPQATYDNYDTKGHALQVMPKSGIKESYEWGYNNSLTVAMVLNAENSSAGIKEFFYQGFETSPVTAAVIPYAGNNCYFGDFTVPYNKPNAKNYVVDYRYYNGTRWLFVKKPYSNQMVLSEGVAIDEVRVYPENAQMSTYTHSPLIGITSETDKNGKAVFYGYDEHNRLAQVYDEDKNIIKAWCYNQAGQRENCLTPFGNDHMSRQFTRTNCGPDYVGETVPYTIKKGVYVSLRSKEEANQQALNDINNNGQNYVNQYGPCTRIVYARLEPVHTGDYIVEEEYKERQLMESRATLNIHFYLDEACTQPATVAGLALRVYLDPDTFFYTGGGPEYIDVECHGTVAEVAQNVAMYRVDSWWNPAIEWWQTLATTNLHHSLYPSVYIRIK